uniref:Chitin-binding type-2 domain-containing protein n=1 Tax=Heterorhabditis bacteriophora TaxID=37862 RepID=A0A1I7XK62_HETBA
MHYCNKIIMTFLLTRTVISDYSATSSPTPVDYDFSTAQQRQDKQQLFYDAETDKCEHKENIPDCGGIRPPSTPAFDYHHYETDFDCAEKVDGFYEKERCQTRFYSCTGGMAKELHCSANLVFDQYECSIIAAKIYIFKFNCIIFVITVNSSRERTTPLPPVIGGDHGNVGVIKPTFSKLKFDCTGKKDGYYALEKCAGSYIQCVTGTPYQLSCPSGLFFNEYVGQCDYKMKCNESSVHDDSTEVIVPSCANLTNGAHASASCSDRFVECWDGTTTQARCQPGLVFNQYNTQCDHKRNVPDCNPGMEFPLLGTNKSVDTREIPVTTETIGEKITTDPYCEHMPDGVHGSGCQNFFYWCDKGITYKKFCPPELFYNSRSTMCDYKNNIIDCSNQKNLTSVQNYSPFYTPLNYLSPPVTAAPKQVVQIEERIESPATFDCSGRADGLYALHQCTALFVQCWNNNRVPHSCQEGLFYNEKNGMCDYKENVPSCNGISTILAVNNVNINKE